MAGAGVAEGDLQAIMEEGQKVGLDRKRKGQLVVDDDADHPQRRAAQGEGIAGAGGLFVDGPEAGEEVELVGERHRDRDGFGRNAVRRAERLVMIGDGVGDGGGFALRQRVIATHDALQFGELADHVGGEIGFRQHRGALGLLDIGADLGSDLGSELDQPLDPLELRSKLGVEHRFLELGQAMLERQLQVGLVEEFCVAEAGADDALVAGNDQRAAIGRKVVGGQEELVGELALAVAQVEAFLVGADGGDDRLFRDGEKTLLEAADHHHGPFDEAGDLFEEALVGNDGQALREGEVVGLGADDVLPAVEIEHHLGALERGDVVVEAADLDGFGGEEAVAIGGLPGRHGVDSEGDHHRVFGVGAKGRGDGAERPHPGQPAMAPLHRLGPGEIGDGLAEDGGQQFGGGRAGLVDVGDVELALFGIGLDFRLIDGAEAGGFEETVDRRLRGADARALLVLVLVGRAGRNAGDGQRQPARRRKGPGALIEQARLDQGVGDGLLQILGGLALEARGDFLGEQFKQQFGHFWTGCEGARGLARVLGNVQSDERRRQAWPADSELSICGSSPQ